MIKKHSFERRKLACAMALVLGAGSVHAATITVTDGGDSGTTGTCTLRQALETASTAAASGSCALGTGNDVVQFAPALANATITLNGTAPLQVQNATVSIVGSGQTIDANGGSNLLALNHAPATLSNLTLTGAAGAKYGNSAIAAGDGALVMDNVTISGNASLALFANGADIDLTDCVISNNSGPVMGGVFVIDSNLALTRSVVSGNSGTFMTAGLASLGTGSTNTQFDMVDSTVANNRLQMAVYGTSDKYSGFAGVMVYANSATISGSTISGNAVTGILPADSALSSSGTSGLILGTVTGTVTNSTIADNTAVGSLYSTGGIYLTGYGQSGVGAIALANTTISGNTATGAAGGAGVGGLVVVQDATAVAVQLTNTILAGNPGSTNSDFQAIAGSLAAVTNSLLGSSLAAGYPGNGNVFSDNPGLAPLANNGGLTQTRALQNGSPAINAGSNALLPVGVVTDQRGAGFDRIVNGTVDIGSYEAVATPLAVAVAVPATSLAGKLALGFLAAFAGLIALGVGRRRRRA